jgi:cytochrome c5
MSEEHQQEPEEHASGIRTPKQLITVLAAAFIIPVLVIIMLAQFVTLQDKESPGSQSFTQEAIAKRLAPVASLTLRDANAPVVYKTGEEVFNGQCTNCHKEGLLGAPKFGDAAAWGPRIAKGFDELWHSALNGKGSMPKQGGGDFSDYEIARAVVYMADHGGAKFAEPAAPASSAPASAAPASDAGSGAVPAAASAAAPAASK